MADEFDYAMAKDEALHDVLEDITKKPERIKIKKKLTDIELRE